MPVMGPDEAEQDGYVERLARYARDLGREPSSVGIDALVTLPDGGRVHEASSSPRRLEDVAVEVAKWQALGASHLTVNTMGAGFRRVQDHIEALQRFTEILGRSAAADGAEADSGKGGA
jgi:hypothetical protein